jgi:hypothetical protein
MIENNTKKKDERNILVLNLNLNKVTYLHQLEECLTEK